MKPARPMRPASAKARSPLALHVKPALVAVALQLALCSPGSAAGPAGGATNRDLLALIAAERQKLDELGRRFEEERLQGEERRRLIEEQSKRLEEQAAALADLRSRLAELEAQGGASGTGPEPAAPAGAGEGQGAPAGPLELGERSASRVPELPPEVVSAGNFPGSIRVPGTDAAVKLGGRVRFGAVATLAPLGSDDRFLTCSILVGDANVAGEGKRTSFTANTSRFNFELRTPTGIGHMRAFLEGDFAGGGNAYRTVLPVLPLVLTMVPLEEILHRLVAIIL